MEKDWELLHSDATFNHWSAVRKKEHISLKNKEINQSAAHNKNKKVEIRRLAEKWHPYRQNTISKKSILRAVLPVESETDYIILEFTGDMKNFFIYSGGKNYKAAWKYDIINKQKIKNLWNFIHIYYML